MEVLVKTLHPKSVVPSYAKFGDAGFDFVATEGKVINPGLAELIPTGISVQIPVGFEIQVRPRSGLALKHSITVLNSPGTIDSGYRGEIGVILINHGTEWYEVKQGDRIAQGVLCSVENAQFRTIDVLNPSQRGTGGFGHSGIS